MLRIDIRIFFKFSCSLFLERNNIFSYFRLVLITSLLYLSLVHIKRQYYSYSSYTLDISGKRLFYWPAYTSDTHYLWLNSNCLLFTLLFYYHPHFLFFILAITQVILHLSGGLSVRHLSSSRMCLLSFSLTSLFSTAISTQFFFNNFFFIIPNWIQVRLWSSHKKW